MTDEQLLISRAQDGEADAFRELVERSKMNVFHLAFDLTGNRHDAEDMSQEVFVKAFRSLSSFKGNAKWSTWIYRITVNTCLDHRRSKVRNAVEFNDDPDDHPAGSGVSPDQSADSRMIQQHVDNALKLLPPQERSVFVLRHYHDLPLKQIASILELAEGTVKSHLFRAIQRLQRELAFYRKDLGLENQP